MKKVGFILFAIFMCVVFSACSNNNQLSTNTIHENETNTDTNTTISSIFINAAKTNDIRLTAMKAAGVTTPFLFDVSHPHNINSFSLWLDKYEDGNFIASLNNFITYVNETEGHSEIYVSGINISEIEQKWILTIKQDQSMSSQELILEHEPMKSLGASAIPELEVSPNEEVAIGYVVMNIKQKDFLIIGNDRQDNINNNDIVYVIKAIFKTE